MKFDAIKKLDDFGRRHPGWMLAAVFLLAALSVLVVLLEHQPAVVLYETF